MDLEEVALALDAFPHWDESMRAEVFHAVDTAPDTYPEDEDAQEDYFGSAGHKAWSRIREYYVTPPRYGNFPVYIDLDEAAGFESIPTKEDILAALYRGERLAR